MQEKVNNVTTSEDVAKVVQEFEQIIKNKKCEIIWLTYHQGHIFQKFKEKERFVSMVSQFGVTKSTIVFEIALFKLIGNYPKIKISSLFQIPILVTVPKILKTITEICKKNASEFKQIIKIC